MKIDVLHIAKLAKLPISPKEKIRLEKQLSETIEYVKELNKVDTKNVESVSQVTGLENITREDKAKPSLSQDEALSGAKSKHNGFFKVDGIFNEE
ncbi:Asp-tRNA(Asn)/Glu-tRNA(Gln) amidotransferase subunit GatC [Patescibacteria group bacterium]|nr:Asp-tRNA(Asn)/Glu-tRNA(Gln) amidotransferase subunit GatC [Patescibacteria group bacterium]